MFPDKRCLVWTLFLPSSSIRSKLVVKIYSVETNIQFRAWRRWMAGDYRIAKDLWGPNHHKGRESLLLIPLQLWKIMQLWVTIMIYIQSRLARPPLGALPLTFPISMDLKVATNNILRKLSEFWMSKRVDILGRIWSPKGILSSSNKLVQWMNKEKSIRILVGIIWIHPKPIGSNQVFWKESIKISRWY